MGIESEAGRLVDLAGWIVYGLTFLVPLLARELRQNGRATLVVWISLLAHQLLALRNAYLGGLSFDALAFHMTAERLSHTEWYFGIGEHFYGPALGYLYRTLGLSTMLGVQLSILAFVASCIVFAKLARLLGVEKYTVPMLAIYALAPAMLMLTSTTIREPYQILFFMTAVYAGLRYRIHGDLQYLGACVASALLMGVFHNGLIAFAPVLVSLIALWRIHSTRVRRGFISRRGLVLLVSVLPVVALGVGFVGRLAAVGITGSNALQVLGTRRVLTAVARYREGGMDVTARATYGVRLDLSSPGGAARSVVLIAAYYMFAPFPWQVRSPLDAYGAMESILRLVLLIGAVRLWMHLRGPPRRVVAVMLVLYFGLAAMWGIGTVNYGTALRHHLTTTWILLLLGGPAVIDAVARGMQRLTSARDPDADGPLVASRV